MVSRNSKRIASRSRKRFGSHVVKGIQQRIPSSVDVRRTTRAVYLKPCGFADHVGTRVDIPVGKWFTSRFAMHAWEPATTRLLTSMVSPAIKRWSTGLVSRTEVRVGNRVFLPVTIPTYKRSSTALEIRALMSDATQSATRIPVRIVTRVA